MENKLLKNVNGFNLVPDDLILKLLYSESKIMSLCEQYMEDKVGIELDFNLDIYSDYNDGKSTTEFSFTADFDALDEEEFELLEKANIQEEELLETILTRVFDCPYWINISVYTVYGEGTMFEIEMPLKYLNNLKTKK